MEINGRNEAHLQKQEFPLTVSPSSELRGTEAQVVLPEGEGQGKRACMRALHLESKMA